MNKERMDELFLKACKGIIKQGKQSTNGNGTCMYRGEGKLKCAIGHMIPDKMYTNDMEFNNFSKLCNADYFWVNDDFAKHFGYDSQKEMEKYVYKNASSGHVFGALQNIHDEIPCDENYVKEFKRNAAALARRFRLKESAEYLKSV
jgi:hypothetical protein